ncbi:MAG: PKD domain-containing protein [Deltaproteobacteria bacterium]|nr:PKD domain-containing protein [Deltaproteobacteria bacterium]
MHQAINQSTNKLFNHLPVIVASLCITLFTMPDNIHAGQAILSWDPPTTNADGTPLTDLAGYKLYYGTAPGNYSQSIDVGNVTTYTINNLIDGFTYYFAVTSYDTSGNESSYSNEVNKTISSSDTTPPQTSGVYASNITTTTATINWTTDELSDTQVEYGTTISYGNFTTLNIQLVTSHSQALNVLSPSTLYYYRVRSRDSSGNLTVSTGYTFTTSAITDTTPPVISNVQVTNITSSSVTIAWTTNEASTSQVEYGFTSSYGSLTNLDSNLVTTHSVNITGLSSYTNYNFRVRSKDVTGNEALSGNYTFTTSNLSPTITSFSANPVTGITPLSVNFTVSTSDSDGYITKYEWDFDGDGNYDRDTAGVLNTSFIYTNAGAYNARVRVTDNGGASTVSNTVTITVQSPVNQPPVVSSFKANSGSGTTPLPVTFSTVVSDPDGSIVQYEWDFDGNGTYDATTTSNPVSYTYNNEGTYTARVRVTDDQGATATGEVTIAVSKATTESGISSASSSGGGSSGGGGGGCFIATAAYGSYLDPHVMVLREFRDEWLLGSFELRVAGLELEIPNLPGHAFVAAYYKISPPIADFIAKYEGLRMATRSLLTPIVFGIEYPLGLSMTLIAVTGYMLRRRYLRHGPKGNYNLSLFNVPNNGNDLSPGTYYFAVTAYDTSGDESGYSNEVSKTMQ